MEKVDVLVVGAGFAGMYMLYCCRKIALRAVCLEAAPSVGGTWYHNRYPGARVDIESQEYSYSFSEELQQDWEWSERYSSQPEILRYANHVADRFDLRKDIQLNTRVIGAQWAQEHSHWLVRTDGGDTWHARYIVLATGPLSTPNFPTFPGHENYKGKIIHTANWPKDDFDLGGLKVGVVGTGSTGMQVISNIAPKVSELKVFQRSAAYVVPAHNRPTDPIEAQRTKAGYAAFRAQNRKMMGGYGSAKPPNMVSALDVTQDERFRQFEDRWNYGGFFISGAFYDLTLNAESAVHVENYIKSKIRKIVKDPQTAERLCPKYRFWCKRLCVDSDGYYETFNLPNVKLVDISSKPIARFTETGLEVDGENHELDAVVLATGFDALTGTILRIGIRGKDGLKIQDKWRDGPMNYLGMAINGFPNMFYMAGAGSATAFTNVIVSIEHHADFIAALMHWMTENKKLVAEVQESAEGNWMDHVQAMAEKTTRLSCSSWYLGANIPGKPRRFMPLSGGFPAYAQKCRDVAEGGYTGFAFS